MVIKKMRKRKFQNLSNLEKEKLIVEYLKKTKNKTSHPSDIAIYYDWDLWKTFQICEKMISEGLLIKK